VCSTAAAALGLPLVVAAAPGAEVPEGPCPVQWAGSQAVVRLPEHLGASDSGPIRDQLLDLVDQGAAMLIADMTGTVSCDHDGADALVRVHHRAHLAGAQLRVAVTAPAVRRVLEAVGLDRLVPVYPSAEAAIAAGTPGVIPLVPRPGPAGGEGQAGLRPGRGPRGRFPAAVITPGVLWRLVDALDDGVILAGEDGVLMLANRRAEEMYGYRHGELTGQPVELLVPSGLRAAHARQRAEYARQPVARPMGSRARLAGRRKDGSTFPAQVSLSPVATATGRFILAVIRDMTREQPGADLAELARAAAAAEDARRGRELLGRVAGHLMDIGLSLQEAAGLPREATVQRIADALRGLDDTIREIHDHVFAAPPQDGPLEPGPSDRSG
jgi:anti-anti-sigma factor